MSLPRRSYNRKHLALAAGRLVGPSGKTRRHSAKQADPTLNPTLKTSKQRRRRDRQELRREYP